VTATTIQADLRTIAAELIDGASGREAAGHLLEIAEEIDSASQVVHAVDAAEIQRSLSLSPPPRTELAIESGHGEAAELRGEYQRSLSSGYGGAGVTWNG